MKTGKELALDDDMIRNANTRRLLDNVEKVGDAFVRGQKLGRWMTIYVVIIIGIICFMIFGTIFTIALQGGMNNFFDNFFPSESVGRRYFCWTGDFNVTYRLTEEIKNFKLVWPEGDCSVYYQNGG